MKDLASMYDTIPKQTLKTFSMLQIKKTTAGKEIILKADNTVRYSAECYSLAAIDS